MLFSASVHMCMSVAVMSPTQYELAYGDPVEIVADVNKKYNWTASELVPDQKVKIYGSEKNALERRMLFSRWYSKYILGVVFILCIAYISIAGVFSYALAVLLGITSLPSVTNVLTWKEFAFVQSKLGWTCMIFACAHDMFYGWPYINGP